MDPRSLILGGSTRMVVGSATEIRIRTGIWNFEEAVIDLSNEPSGLQRAIIDILKAVAAGRPDLPASWSALDPVSRASAEQLLSDLVEGGFLVPGDGPHNPVRTLDALLGRPLNLGSGSGDVPSRSGGIVMLSDSEQAYEHAAFLARSLSVDLQPVSNDQFEALRTADLVSRIDGRGTMVEIEQLCHLFDPSSVVLCVMRNPSLRLLRNLNRVVEAASARLVVSLLDGPFLTVLGTQPPHTGCIECFEQRSLARLEDHVAYHNFAEASLGSEDAAYGPIMAFATNLALVEAAMWTQTGSTRTVGRALSFFLPTLEIQAQRLLRIASCPACGQHSKERLKEINFSTRAALDRIIDGVLQ